MKELIDKRLSELIPEPSDLPHGLLYTAARYALTEGKRLRPLLALTTARAFGLPIEKALTSACCLELIHTYSLIHDDLPCMDDDDMRRGRPSLHRAFPEGQAVLAGDFLLTYAFELLATCSTIAPKQRLALITELAKASGGEGMIGGQVVDIATKEELLSEEKLYFIHTKKTAALIAASLVFGGILAEVSEEEKEILRSIGISLGIAFQFADDLSDETPHLPKPQIEKIIHRHFNDALQKLEKLSGNMSELYTLFHAIIHNTYDKAPI